VTYFGYPSKVRQMLNSVKLPPPDAADRRRAAVRVFDALCTGGPATRVGLVEALGASASTITAAVQELRLDGFVVETGTAASTGGRRATIIELARSLGCVLAVDVGAINVRVAAADVAGRIYERTTFPTSPTTDSKRFRRVLLTALDNLAHTRPGPVLAITLAVPAIVEPETRQVSLATVPGWPAGDPGRWLERFEAPVLVENEANLGALGECAQGIARGARDVLFVALGAGVGAGVVIGGRLYRGATGAAGEIGFLRRSLSSQPRELEQEAAGPAIVRHYRAAGGNAVAPTAEMVFERAETGDAAARAAVAAAIEELAIGIANAIIVLNPEVVVLGGGLAAAGSALLDPLRERIRPLVPAMPKVVAAGLGPDAALVGATVWAAQEAQGRLRATLELARG
jgi:predicted NBD/HSP70 family sugar kinase